MNDRNRPIGVFDSGIGGLSVLRQLIRFLPYEDYIYLGDTARVPYGNKSPEIVKQYSRECANFLLEKGVKMIVVACNTASALALDAIKEVAGEMPVIGMINPAAAAALRATNGRIGIIGTRGTVASGAYLNGINSLKGKSKIEVTQQACPLFVPLVEEGMIDGEITQKVAEDYISPLQKEKVDTIVLGCTHYPLLAPMLSRLIPGIKLIDSGEHAAVTALRQLADADLLRDEKDEYVVKPQIDFYVTDVPAQFHDLAKLFLGFDIQSPHKVILG